MSGQVKFVRGFSVRWIRRIWQEKKEELTAVTIAKFVSPFLFGASLWFTIQSFSIERLVITSILSIIWAVAYEVDNFANKVRKEVARVEPFFSLVHDSSHRYLTTFCSDLVKGSANLVTNIPKGKVHISASTIGPIDQEFLFYSVLAEILNRFLRDQGKDIQFIKMMHDLPLTGAYPSLISKLQQHTRGLPDEARDKVYKLYVFQGRMQYDSDDFKLEAPKLGNEAWRWAPQLPFGNLLFEENIPEENIRLLYRNSQLNFGKDNEFEVYYDPEEKKPLTMALAYDGECTVEFAVIKASHRGWPLLSRKREETVKVAVKRNKQNLSFLSGDIFLDPEIGRVWDESYFEKLFLEAKKWKPANAEVALNSAYNIALNGTSGNTIHAVDYNLISNDTEGWFTEGSPKWMVWRASMGAAKNGATVKRIFLVSNALLDKGAQSSLSPKWLNYELLLVVLALQEMVGIKAKVLTINEYQAEDFAARRPVPDFALILTLKEDLIRGIVWKPHAEDGSERHTVIHTTEEGNSWKELFQKIDNVSHEPRWLLEKIKQDCLENDPSELVRKVVETLTSRAEDRNHKDWIEEWEKIATKVLGN